ncbi:MAG: hypothetical protein ABIR77_05095 [Sphingomicrobium sp.]
MKPREPRRKVLIKARMRAGPSWGGVSLLNLSSRGALAQAEVPPPKGSYIEVRCGAHVIVARVMWAEQERFGFRSQDPILVDALLANRDEAVRTGQPAPGMVSQDRRAVLRKPSPSDRHERSRATARTTEYCCLVAIAALLGSVAVSMVQSALGGPMTLISAALSLP